MYHIRLSFRHSVQAATVEYRGVLKALISAYYCEPGKGSEEAVGWNTAREAAKHCEVWVLTRTLSRPSVEVELSRKPTPNLHFVYYDLPGWFNWWARGTLLEWHLYYYIWQICIYFVARSLHSKVRFDLVHHVTFVKYWIPSFLVLLPVPLIWGPVGGGEDAPKAFRQAFGTRGIVLEVLRDLGRWLGEHDPFVRLTARRSVLAIATTPETAARMLRLGTENVQLRSQLGLAREEIDQLGRRTADDGSPLRIISIGRLLHWKGFHLGLEAYARADLPRSEYWVVGDGPERRRLQKLAKTLGVEDRVRFWGYLPREEALTQLVQCHILLHPSLHDSGGGVCLEAMAAGLPIVCLGLGGPAVVATEETAFIIPAHFPEQAVRALADALKRLGGDYALRLRLGAAAQERVRRAYSWETKGQLWARLYKDIAGRR
jgi:glycosyltransferase involved in cell wall biosynthesis